MLRNGFLESKFAHMKQPTVPNFCKPITLASDGIDCKPWIDINTKGVCDPRATLDIDPGRPSMGAFTKCAWGVQVLEDRSTWASVPSLPRQQSLLMLLATPVLRISR